MLAEAKTRKEIRDALWNPANGRQSSELDILAPAKFRQGLREMHARERSLSIQARGQLGADLVERFRREVALWALSTADNAPEMPNLPRVRLDHIILAVCKFYNVTQLDIMSPRRDAKIIRPRHVIVYLATTLTLLSLPQIGLRLTRDHTTIVSARNKMIGLIADDLDLAAEVAQIRDGLLGDGA